MNRLELLQNQKDKYLEDLFDFLRIPSITRDKDEVKKAAKWLENRLALTANYVEIVETKGNPAIIAEWEPQINLDSEQKKPVLLYYGHYDVQPPEPLDEWISPPFEPEIREGRIYARGVGDNKGQLFANLCGIEWLHKKKQLSSKVKFIFDGEEELGSPNLEEALKAKKEFFKDIDLVIVSGDVHSGNFGGIQPNPVWDVIKLLRTMRDENGKCLIEGFYNDVFIPTEAAIKAAEELNRDPEIYKEQLGISYFGGEQDLPLTHRLMFRPTFNIRGFKSGDVQENAKTMIPKEAIVEIDVRLVPNQTPEKMTKLIQAHFEMLRHKSERFAAIIDRCTLKFGSSFYPMFTSLELPWTQILEKAIEEGFEEKPIKIPLAGGSLPLYSLYKVTGKPMYVIPYAQPDEDNHAPNENMMVDWFLKGINTSIAILENIGKQ
ncbi:MAG: M20/M25/M40 family metallo-hydrolase [Candidatus Heimdallarchaeota archaeon]